MLISALAEATQVQGIREYHEDTHMLKQTHQQPRQVESVLGVEE